MRLRLQSITVLGMRAVGDTVLNGTDERSPFFMRLCEFLMLVECSLGWAQQHWRASGHPHSQEVYILPNS